MHNYVVGETAEWEDVDGGWGTILDEGWGTMLKI